MFLPSKSDLNLHNFEIKSNGSSCQPGRTNNLNQVKQYICLRKDWVDPLDNLAANNVEDERFRGNVEVATLDAAPFAMSIALLERSIPLDLWPYGESLNVSKSVTI